MRINVKKFLFIGVEQERIPFFQSAQEGGFIHFIEKSSAKVKHIPDDVQKLTSAIKILRCFPPVDQEEDYDISLSHEIVEKVLTLKQRLEKKEEEKRINHLEMARVAAFGDFSKEDIEYIEREGKVRIQFFFSKRKIFDGCPLPSKLIYVASHQDLDYFVAINHENTQYDKLVEIKISHPLGYLKAESVKINRELDFLEKQLKGYSKYNVFLHHCLVERLNTYHLHAAENEASSPISGAVFAIEGWVPESKIAMLSSLADTMDVHIEEIAIDEADKIPTCLENQGAGRIGEDIINIYDTPSHTDNDPSLWVLCSFALFFSFIVGDAGYGLIFLIVALYTRYKLFPTASSLGKRMMNLSIILCGSVIVWGFLMNSFFGISSSPGNPLRQASLMQWLVEKKANYHIQHHDVIYADWTEIYPLAKDIKDPALFVQQCATCTGDKVDYALGNKFADNILLELALFVGVVHILISLLRYLPRNTPSLGWILVVIGGYLYIPFYLDATSLIHFVFGINKEVGAEVGLYLVFSGLVIACVLSLFKNGFSGILEIMGIIQIFSDVMSYLRLYALGLSGSIVSATINEVVGVVPFAVAIVIVAVGHLINMVLSIMSGVIHGLRLNFLEWYHYSFEGGGKPFKPLRKMKIIE